MTVEIGNLKDANNIEKYYKAIKNKKISLVKKMIKSEKLNKQDILLEIYNNYGNTFIDKDLEFTIDNLSNDLSISSNLIKKLIKDGKLNLLRIIFEKFKFYDNNFIIYLLSHYKNKTPMTTSHLKQKLSYYKISFCNGSSCGCKSSYRENFVIGYLNGACNNGNEFLVKYLIELGININGKSYNNWAPLHHACYYGDENIVKCLVEHGANVNEKGEYGNTGLHIACKNGQEEIIKYLVEHGGNINEKNQDGETALYMACKNENNLNLIRYLIEHGGDIKGKTKFDFTAIHGICNQELKRQREYDNQELNRLREHIIDYLITKGVDINKRGRNGNTPLHIACKKGNKDLIKYLIEHGADISRIDFKGCTPLQVIPEDQQSDIIKYLIENEVIP